MLRALESICLIITLRLIGTGRRHAQPDPAIKLNLRKTILLL